MELCESSAPRRGLVFNLQRYSLHDGPGIRTLVFLKGCPMRCRWCCNPESQNPRPELAFDLKKCIGLKECGKCLEVCPQRALRAAGDRIAIDRKSCESCFRCAEVCPARALSIFGRWMSVEEVLQVVVDDVVFYSRSGGGLTVSGGEPLSQAEFALELIEAAKRRRIDTALATGGCGAWADLAALCERVDTVLYDIKCIDEARHRKFTGRSNKVVLENFKRMCAAFPGLPVWVRTPVIPGFNDASADIEAIMDFIDAMPNVNYELLPYHRLGRPKYESLGRGYPLGKVKLDDEKLAQLKEIARSRSCHAA